MHRCCHRAASLLVLLALLTQVTLDGFGRIDWDFITNFSSRRVMPGSTPHSSEAPISSRSFPCVPIGIGAAIYLEEYNSGSRLAQLIEVNT